MKFVYFIILGLIIFNTAMILTSSMFDTSRDVTAADYEDYKLKQPRSIVDILFSDRAISTWGSAGGVFSVIVAIGVIGAIVVKNYVVAAIAIFLGLVTALYIGASAILFNISDNVYVHSIISLIGIAICLLVLYNVIEMVSGTGGDA